MTQDEINDFNAYQASCQATVATRAVADIRAERDRRLTKSDRSQLGDVVVPGTQQEWATYRQSLRDLPASVADARAFMQQYVEFQAGMASDPWPVEPA